MTTRPNEAALVTSLPDIRQMYGWCVWAETMAPMRLSSPAAMASISGPLKFTHLSTSMYSLPVGVTFGSVGGDGGRLRAALVQQHDERLDASARCLSFRTSALAVTTSSRNSSPATPDGVTTVGVRLEGHADERDLRVADLLDLVGREDRAVRAGEEHVGREVLEERAGERRSRPGSRRPGGSRCRRAGCRTASAAARRSPSSNSWLPTPMTSKPIEFSALDRRLVVEERRDQRAGADHVARADRRSEFGWLGPQRA